MTMTVNITDFRNNIFKYAALIQKGYELEVERSGSRIMAVGRPKVDDRRERAEKLLRLLKKWGGKFPDWDIDIDKMRRNKVEMDYIKNLDNRVKW